MKKKEEYITKKETRFVYVNTMTLLYTHPQLVQTKIKRSTPKATVVTHFLIHILVATIYKKMKGYFREIIKIQWRNR